ncbi:MAG: pantoate--beta-alanine ligase [Planctomycetota bacterium]
MKISEHSQEAYAHVDHWRKEGLKVGLVPTMGALHEGHFSLVDRCRDECDIVVATIFVNPTQFGPNEDLDRYPRTMDEDLAGLKRHGADLVFTPSAEELYPAGFSTFVEPPRNALPLEGQFRPGHFRGVTTVVMKYFQIIPAHIAYFGSKDYQQFAVIRSMVEDLDVPVRVQGCETVREKDGLAMSSRNRYLSPDERERALAISAGLFEIKTSVEGGESNVETLKTALNAKLTPAMDSIDYATIVDATTLNEIESLTNPAVALVAAYVGSTRLIDNITLG